MAGVASVPRWEGPRTGTAGASGSDSGDKGTEWHSLVAERRRLWQRGGAGWQVLGAPRSREGERTGGRQKRPGRLGLGRGRASAVGPTEGTGQLDGVAQATQGSRRVTQR